MFLDSMTPCVDLSRRQRLLIVKLSSIGDVVQALPVAVALRRRYPRLRISWAVEEWVAPLLAGHPAIDRLVVMPPLRWGAAGRAWLRRFTHAVRSVRSESYDVSLDLQGLLKSSVVALLSRAPLRIGMHGQREGARLVSHPVPHRPGRLHVVDDYLQCAEFLGAMPTPVTFDLPVHPLAGASIAHTLAMIHDPPDAALIVINPSASGIWKTWPPAHWGRVARALAEAGTVVLIGGREQRARHAEVARQASRRLYDLTGRTTLAELVALLDRCTVHVAPDTGSAHIAAALGRPVVGLYGPTAPWRKAPYGQADRVVYHEGLCATGCPHLCLWRRRCLQAATPDELIDQARRALMAS